MAQQVALAVVILVALLTVVAAVFVIRSAGRQQAARYNAVQALCAARGLEPGPIQLSPDFVLPRSGGGRELNDQFTLAADLSLLEGKVELFFSIVTARFPGIQMPHVAVHRRAVEGVLPIGDQKVELESIDFNNLFWIRARDPRAAVMLLDPEMMQWFIDCGEVSMEISGNQLLAYVARSKELLSHGRMDAHEFELLFKFVDGFGRRIPALLRTSFANAEGG